MIGRERRKLRVRSKIKGRAERPRVVIFRSNRHIYLQAIDDQKKSTLASASDLKDKDLAQKLAKDLIDKKIKKIVFDRSGYKYHGNIQEIADGLRKAGLEF